MLYRNVLNSFDCNWFNSNLSDWRIWFSVYHNHFRRRGRFFNCFENLSVNFGNYTQWNVSKVSNLECFNISWSSWTNCRSKIVMRSICKFNRNIFNSINTDWMNSLVLDWYKMLISNFKNRGSLFINWKQNFWNLTNWNVSLSFSGDWCNSGCWKTWIFEYFTCWGSINWDVSNSIFNDWFSRWFVCHWDVIDITNFNGWMRNFFSCWLYFIFKDWLEYFWNSVQWNVCYVSDFENIDGSIFVWSNSSWFINWFRSLLDWNIRNSFNNNWLYIFLSYWNVVTTIYFNHNFWLICSRQSFWDLSWNFCGSSNFTCILVFKDRLESFRNYIYRNVCFVSDFESTNLFISFRMNWRRSVYMRRCNMDWNVSLTFNDDWFSVLFYRNVEFTVDLNNWRSDFFDWFETLSINFWNYI